MAKHLIRLHTIYNKRSVQLLPLSLKKEKKRPWRLAWHIPFALQRAWIKHRWLLTVWGRGAVVLRAEPIGSNTATEVSNWYLFAGVGQVPICCTACCPIIAMKRSRKYHDSKVISEVLDFWMQRWTLWLFKTMRAFSYEVGSGGSPQWPVFCNCCIQLHAAGRTLVRVPVPRGIVLSFLMDKM